MFKKPGVRIEYPRDMGNASERVGGRERYDDRGLNNKIRVIQRRSYGLRDEEYLRLKILTCMPGAGARAAGVSIAGH